MNPPRGVAARVVQANGRGSASFPTTPIHRRKPMNAVAKETAPHDYKVRDISQPDLGRKRITMAEQEMPGLMQILARYAPQKPLKGARVTRSLHMTNETAVLIEPLTALGSAVR